MKPNSERRRAILESIRKLTTSSGRGVTLKEIAHDLGRSLPSIHHHIARMVEAGLVTQGLAGKGKGIQLAEGDRSFNLGWGAAVQSLRPVLATTLLAHHASETLTQAVSDALDDAQGATHAPEETPQKA